MRYVRRRLGSEALLYIQDQIANGKSLAHIVQSSVNLTHGSVTTFLPESVSASDANSFLIGGKLQSPPEEHWIHTCESVLVPIPNTFSILVAEILDFLLLDMSHVCIIQNAPAKRNDPCISLFSSRVLYFEDEVYHVVDAADASNENILEAINDSFSFRLFLGFLSRKPHVYDLEIGSVELSQSQLLALGRETVKIFVGAYDGEGFLLWGKSVCSNSD
jgi:hypothetical protein